MYMKPVRRAVYALIVTILLVAGLPTAAWAVDSTVSGEILVGYRSNGKLEQRGYAFAQESELLAQVAGLQVAVLRVPTRNVAATLLALRSDPAVAYAEPNGIMEGTWDPNDPDYNNPDKVYAPQQIKANLAWDLGRGSGDVVVAVVDSGVDFAHPDLAGSLWVNADETPGNGVDDDGNGYVDDVSGWDFVNHDNLPADDLGHGTHVSGIAAATTNNGVGVAGIAGGVKVLPVKVLNSSNQGTWADIAQGIIYAADQGVRAINLSLGSTSYSNTVLKAIQYAQSHGVLVIAAAGNNGAEQLFYPAAYAGVLAIAATSPGGARWSLSNYGSFVDLAAPGVTVYSTCWTATAGSIYQFMSGTSMATPMVTGVAALLWSINPALTATEVSDFLTQSATDLGDPGQDIYYGHGQVDAQAAAVLAQGALRRQDTLPPSGAVDGYVWIDQNGDGQRQLNEDNGLADVAVRLYTDGDSQGVAATTDAQGRYDFSALSGGSYTLEVASPPGYIGTTPTRQQVVMGQAQSAKADFGFVAPTVVYVQYLDVTPGQGHIDLTWGVSGAALDQGWHVRRGGSDLATAKRITAQPILGTPDGADVVVYSFEDAAVVPGQTYWYWLEDGVTGDLFGPQQDALPAADGDLARSSHVFLPFVNR
ncbi:MAG: hypothetical protein CVU38_15120 [Chloroflexi bacterium HGW-Chloroflexi-1]|nr:MAG: hypothetical protein CVU38_15120 [Chloroflexi bacterium HGW-Chloroflexi-1]